MTEGFGCGKETSQREGQSPLGASRRKLFPCYCYCHCFQTWLSSSSFSSCSSFLSPFVICWLCTDLLLAVGLARMVWWVRRRGGWSGDGGVVRLICREGVLRRRKRRLIERRELEREIWKNGD